ncbi:MAG: hypothetical protein HY986_13340 [Candidatus Melainabacteria bacterium]|nr:hypothetical protein [Candidatus Melainabacteria bacterium]
MTNFSLEQLRAAAAWCVHLAASQVPAYETATSKDEMEQAFVDEFCAYLEERDSGLAYEEFMEDHSGCVRIGEPLSDGISLMSRALRHFYPYSDWIFYGDRIWFSPSGEVYAAMSMATPVRIFPAI